MQSNIERYAKKRCDAISAPGTYLIERNEISAKGNIYFNARVFKNVFPENKTRIR